MRFVPQNEISVEISRNLSGLEQFESDFRSLFNSSKHQPSLSYDWLRCLCMTHLSDTDELLVVRLIDKLNKLVGLVPFVIRTESFFGLPYVSIFPISELYGTHTDILLKNYDEDLLDSLIHGLLELDAKWDVLRLKRVIEGSKLLSSIRSALKKTARKSRLYRAFPSYYLKLEGTFEDYLMDRSSKFRNYLKRKERSLETIGQVSIKEIRMPGKVEVAFQDLLKIEEGSWKHTHGTAISSVDRQRLFYRNICEAAAKAGTLHLMIAKVDKEPIAYNLGVITGRTYYYLKTSYLDKYRKASPASVLRAALVRSMYDSGVSMIDFPGEPYEWEKQWTRDYRWNYGVELCNSHTRARAYWALKELRMLFGKRRSESIKYADPRDLKGKR